MGRSNSNKPPRFTRLSFFVLSLTKESFVHIKQKPRQLPRLDSVCRDDWITFSDPKMGEAKHYQACSFHSLKFLCFITHWSKLRSHKTQNLDNCRGLIVFVGTTGFEPATTRPPDVCATGLRYVPIMGTAKLMASCLFSKHYHRFRADLKKRYSGVMICSVSDIAYHGDNASDIGFLRIWTSCAGIYDCESK